MKFVIPIKRKENEPVNSYIIKCNMWLISFKQILRQRIKKDKLLCRVRTLYNQPNIHWIIPPNHKYDIFLIVNLFINRLQCVYDSFESCCFYTVPNFIKCPYTVTPLNVVIRTLEYGTPNMTPLFWIRPSFRYFIESTVNIQNKLN